MRIPRGLVALVLAAGLVPGLAHAELIYGLTADSRIATFDSATPGSVASSLAITGLQGGDVLVGIDLRPADNLLYSVATSGNLYRLDLSGSGYAAVLVGNIAVGLTGTSYGIDFNPTVDRLRLIDNTDQNLRINPANAVTLTDTPIGGGYDIVGSAYTNNFSGAVSTVLYGLDAAGDQLLRASNPNGGVYFSVGPLGIALDTSNGVGFDISGSTGDAYFNSGSSFYSLNLATGGATLIGSLGSGALVGLTAYAVPEPATWALMIGGFALAGLALRGRRRALGA
ncbi:MAG: DUF4394 domain-containing protein [Phenylobacterium sp.]